MMNITSTLFRKAAYSLGLDLPYIVELAKRLPEDERDVELRALLDSKIRRGELHGAVDLAKVCGIELTSGDFTNIISGIAKCNPNWFLGAQEASELRKSRLTHAELSIFYEKAKKDENCATMGQIAYWFSEPQCAEKLEESIALSVEIGRFDWMQENAALRGRELTAEEVAEARSKAVESGGTYSLNAIVGSTKQELTTDEKIRLLDGAEREEVDVGVDIINIAASLAEPLRAERLTRILRRELSRQSEYDVEHIKKVLGRSFSVDEDLMLVDFYVRRREDDKALRLVNSLPEPQRTEKIMSLLEVYVSGGRRYEVNVLLRFLFEIKGE